MAIIAPFSFMATSFSVPQTVQNNARRGLELRRKHGRGGLTTAEAGKQGIGSGVARARDLMGGSVSLETVKRMSAFFDRHRQNKDTPPEQGNGMISWLLWGGDAGDRWAKGIIRQEEKAKELHGRVWVTTDKEGRYRWVAISSNSYQDREGEIVSQKALETAVNRGDLGNLHWWHDNGAVIGTADFQMMHGKMLIESGTFKSEKIGAAFAGKKGLGVSVGFLHPPTEPQDGIYHNIRIVERSVLPAKKAANGLTRFSAT
jgi:hypothetical protein